METKSTQLSLPKTLKHGTEQNLAFAGFILDVSRSFIYDGQGEEDKPYGYLSAYYELSNGDRVVYKLEPDGTSTLLDGPTSISEKYKPELIELISKLKSL